HEGDGAGISIGKRLRKKRHQLFAALFDQPAGNHGGCGNAASGNARTQYRSSAQLLPVARTGDGAPPPGTNARTRWNGEETRRTSGRAHGQAGCILRLIAGPTFYLEPTVFKNRAP